MLQTTIIKSGKIKDFNTYMCELPIRFFAILFISIFFLASACKREKTNTTLETKKPNVILIMADDMGYECLSSNGSLEYKTPHLDQLAANGIRFTQCIAQPLCTPSRVKIMTGMHNYRNYEYFGYLNPQAKTFAHVMQEAGYKTCISGKWQLNGFYQELPGWKDSNRPYQLGFDEYCLWQLTQQRGMKDGKPHGERYADPIIEQNGKKLQPGIDNYGPDTFDDYIINFIEKQKDSAFFVYYPMVLVHDPFVPTPDMPAWQNPKRRYEKDTAYFKEMMAYTDKIVKRITDKLNALEIADNTLVLFTADNGTHVSVASETSYGVVQGAKGNTIDAGVRVPLIAHWPAKIKNGQVYDGLIEFSDFHPTLAALAGVNVDSTDGKSFLPLLEGKTDFKGRESVFVHYDPQWGKRVNHFRNQFTRNTHFKLYRDGRFFNIKKDVLEEKPLDTEMLEGEVLVQYEFLRKELEKTPPIRFDNLKTK
ncbi:MAG: sulfatase-like hydrolase/transferase [Bacteroidota bacterium]